MIFPENRLDTGKAISGILSGEPVTIQYPGIFDSRFNQLAGFLYRLLGELDLGFITELLLIALKEIISNCVKAHAKRIFFAENGLDIHRREDYNKGIRIYSPQVLGEWDTFIREHQNSFYYVHVTFTVEEGDLLIRVENNAEIQPAEWDRINRRIDIFNQHLDMEKAFADVKDETEGSGLGIVLTLMLLYRVGVPLKNFMINPGRGITITSMRIPLDLTPSEVKVKFKEKILAEIGELPSFPEKITNLVNLCNSEGASVKQIAGEIQKDPALTAQILKLVNSAGYINRFQNPNLLDAVKILGLKVIRNLLLVTGARNVINSRYHYRELEQIWENSNRVSFFAFQLSRSRHTIQDMAAMAGLLHELGRIVLLTFNQPLIKKINELIASGRIRSSWPIEEVELGISHPEVGALLAEKWNFPDSLTQAIRFQQKPLQSPPELEDLIHTVYLAVRIQETSQNLINFYAVEEEILKRFGLVTQEEFLDLTGKLDKHYQS